MAELRIGTTAKRVVVARTEAGELFTIGHVFSDLAAVEIEQEARAAGYEVLGLASAFSRAEFRAREHR